VLHKFSDIQIYEQGQEINLKKLSTITVT